MFAAVLVFWVLVAGLRPSDDAQDAVPLLVAGELVRDEPGAVYPGAEGGIYNVHERFREASCPRLEALDCSTQVVGFVSPPALLSLLMPVSALPNDLAVRGFRLINAGALAAGMLLLWRRLAGRGQAAPLHLAMTAVLLTPFAMAPIGLGQTSPLMFLSAVLGVSVAARSKWWAAAVGALWAANVVTKAIPALLGAVLLLQRRWRLALAIAAAVLLLTALGLGVGGFGLLGDFVSSGRAVQEDSTRSLHTGSIESALGHLTGMADSAQLTLAGMAVRLVALVGAAAFLVRIRDDDVQWALGWAALVVLAPLNWWHYSWVLVAALGVVLWKADGAGKHTWLLPLLGATTVPLGMATIQGWSIPVVPLLWMLATFVVCCILASRLPSRARVSESADSL